MSNVGFDGGSLICELGPASDMVVFFRCLKNCALQHPDIDYSVLTDRLYRRYLRLDDLPIASSLMSEVKINFFDTSSNEFDWRKAGWKPTDTALNVSQRTLGDVFYRYFEQFFNSLDSAKIFFDSWKKYQPVKIVLSDMPYYLEDQKRPLAQYDALSGDPFWLRPTT